MKTILFVSIVSTICLQIVNGAQPTLEELRKKVPTTLTSKVRAEFEVPIPPADLFSLENYTSELGELPAYISTPKQKGKKYPAIIWLVGGFSNSISEVAWTKSDQTNDQSASIFWENDIIVMYPSLRGGNMNPGYIENCYGEVLDVLAALEHLKQKDFVDPNQIYLGGHSTGGTLALLIAATTSDFHSVFSLGPAARVSDYGQNNVNYDTSNFLETNYRAPIRWLDRITSPTFVFEGANGNYSSLLEMMNENNNPNVKFFPIMGEDHFSIIFPVSKMLSLKMKESEISIEESDIKNAFKDK